MCLFGVPLVLLGSLMSTQLVFQKLYGLWGVLAKKKNRKEEPTSGGFGSYIAEGGRLRRILRSLCSRNGRSTVDVEEGKIQKVKSISSLCQSAPTSWQTGRLRCWSSWRWCSKPGSYCFYRCTSSFSVYFVSVLVLVSSRDVAYKLPSPLFPFFFRSLGARV